MLKTYPEIEMILAPPQGSITIITSGLDRIVIAIP